MQVDYKNFVKVFNDPFKKEEFCSTNEKAISGNKTYMFYAKVIIEAFDRYLTKRLHEFDACLGENACQLRAWKILTMALNDNSTGLSKSLTDVKVLTEKFFETMTLFQKQVIEYESKRNIFPRDVEWPKILKEMADLRETCWSRIRAFNDTVRFTDEMIWLIYAYVTTVSKNTMAGGLDAQGFPAAQQSEYQRIMAHFGCSKSKAFGSLAFMQSELAWMSQKYVQQVAKEIGNPLYVDRLGEAYWTKNAKGVLCGPCYYEFAALLLQAKKLNMAVILKVRSFVDDGTRIDFELAFQGRGLNTEFEQIEPSALKGRLALIFEGRSQSTAAVVDAFFRKHGFTLFIKAFAAQHEQYPKKVVGPTLPEDAELNFHKAFAETNGLSLENWKICLLKHVFVDLVE